MTQDEFVKLLEPMPLKEYLEKQLKWLEDQRKVEMNWLMNALTNSYETGAEVNDEMVTRMVRAHTLSKQITDTADLLDNLTEDGVETV